MIKSMTAFTRVTNRSASAPWVIEMRSVNHRYFDFSLRLPPDYYEYESQIRDIIRSGIGRGKVSVNITKPGEESDPVNFDEEAVKKYIRAIRKIKKRFLVPGEVSVREIIALPQIFSTKKTKDPIHKGWKNIEQLLKQGTKKMVLARQSEGSKIMKDITKRLRLVETAVQRIQSRAAKQPQHAFERLRSRLQELLKTVAVDEEKVWKEVAILADRSDITEEIVRMQSHLELFRSYLKAKREIGREMDFLCQEMHREVNTMGAKSQVFDISREVVSIKGELEKIREQVQNVE